MSSSSFRYLSILEKLKAALGAAGLGAIGADLVIPRLLVSITSAETYGFTAAIAVIAALVGAYFTTVTVKEAALEAEAKKESVADTNG